MTLIRPFCVLGLTVISLCAAEPAGTDCKARILDRASVLQEQDRRRIEAASQALINQGADVHVLTTELKKSEPLDAAVKSIIASCPSWQTADGAAQDNLLVLVTAPADGKSTILFGAGWGSALDDHWSSIVTEYMAPRVRNRHYASGFIAAEQQLSRWIQISADKRRQLDHFFASLLSLAGSCLGVYLVRRWIQALRERRQEALTQAELEHTFRDWIDDELLKLTIDSLHAENEDQRRQRERLLYAKTRKRPLAPGEIEKNWDELKRALGYA